MVDIRQLPGRISVTGVPRASLRPREPLAAPLTRSTRPDPSSSATAGTPRAGADVTPERARGQDTGHTEAPPTRVRGGRCFVVRPSRLERSLGADRRRG